MITTTRRQMLATLAVAGSAAMLGSCSQTSRPGGALGPSAALPDFVAATTIPPDLPALDYGVSPGFLRYPADPPKFFQSSLAPTAPVRGLSIVPRAVTQNSTNPYWAELERRLSTTLSVEGAPVDTYSAKLATTIASGDIPDVVQILPGGVPQLPGLLDAKFQSLDDFVSGEHIRDFPALANIPTNSWRSAVVGSHIWGIPLHRSSVRWVGTARTDLVPKHQPESGEELLEMYRALTNKDKGEFALAIPQWVLAFVAQATGSPNEWRLDSAGKLVRALETDEYRRAIDIVAGMWKEGLFHPEAMTANDAQAVQWIQTGVITGSVLQGSWAGYEPIIQRSISSASLDWFAPPRWDGGGVANSHLGPGIYSISLIKKAEPARVREVLGVLNYLAAPFGSEESTFLTYGLPDVHYTMTETGRKGADRASTEIPSVWYLAFRPQVQYSSTESVVRKQYESEVRILKDATPDPTTGFYSEANGSKGAILQRNITSATNDIISGRKPLSSWDEAVSDWRKNGGDEIRQEFETAIQQR